MGIEVRPQLSYYLDAINSDERIDEEMAIGTESLEYPRVFMRVSLPARNRVNEYRGVDKTHITTEIEYSKSPT